MATDLVTTTTAAASALYDAAQESYLALWGATLESQERLVRLTRLWVDESRGSAQAGRALLETLAGSWQAAGEAVQELATAPAAAAGLELAPAPFAFLAAAAPANGASTTLAVTVPRPPKAPRSRPAA
jgi:hypothetical protein